jgi:hypothetical protein
MSGDGKQSISNNRHEEREEKGRETRHAVEPKSRGRADDDTTEREHREEDAERERTKVSLVDREKSQVRARDCIAKSNEQNGDSDGQKKWCHR